MSSEYAGDLAPFDAWNLLASDPEAVLIDVRTAAEWSYVGVPCLSGLDKEVKLISWQVYPSMQRNESFVEEVRAAGIQPDKPVLLICRSGARSQNAAKLLTREGFAKAYNVVAGFEGPQDACLHRGEMDGWKKAGLPWTQS
jgi:rhodanese-related sulfurtransferase